MRLPLWLRLMNPFTPWMRAASTEAILSRPDELAVLVIDAQKEFCDPRGERGHAPTETISKRIRSAVPAFRKRGITIYPVYFSKTEKKLHDIDFFRFRPDYGDRLVAKDRDSAFLGSNIDRLLHKDKKKSLLVCGFNLNACVMDTVTDARRAGYNVILLEDLSGNDLENAGDSLRRECVQEMKRLDIHFENSQQMLKSLKSAALKK